MKLLDLFCGAGLAAWGYWKSGRFSEIVGVDLSPMPYGFDFIQADAYTLTYDFLWQFDFIHASPPCQFYSKATPDRSKHLRSIPGVRQMLYAAGVPHVIENVEGSGRDLRPNLRLTGRDVGLAMSRPRYFYCSFLSDVRASQIKAKVADHLRIASAANLIDDLPSNVRVHGGTATRDELIAAFGLNELPARRLSRISMHHIEQGIPPAFTKAIIELYTPHKFLIGA